MPVNATPEVDAPPDAKWVVLRYRKSENTIFCDKYLGPEQHHGRLIYRCHWETCPGKER